LLSHCSNSHIIGGYTAAECVVCCLHLDCCCAVLQWHVIIANNLVSVIGTED